MKPADPSPASPLQLPSRLPHPLDDPLRFYRKLLNFLLIPWFIAIVLAFALPRLGGPDWGLTIYQIDAAFFFVLGLLVWRLLPREITSAFYLRSFRNDPVAYPIRTVIAQAIGPGFRLSGIRDPRRRWPWIVRHLVYLLFLLRFCRPRFMNLEAGVDWKARLWRSLGMARCAFIDLTVVTPFVLDEVQLAMQSLGPKRVLFVVDGSRSPADWESLIAGQLLHPVPPETLCLALWEDTRRGRRLFARQVSHFANHVPEEAAGLKPEAWSLTQSQQSIHGRSGGRELAFVELGIATLISGGLLVILNWLGSATPPSLHWLWLAPSIGQSLLTLFFLFQYLIESGSIRDWLISGSLLGFVALLATAMIANEWWNPSEGVRGAADLMLSGNNLKRIGIEMLNYQESYRSLPPAIAYTAEGKPLVSWRVLLLPYFDEEALYNAYHLGEPWDSPHNIELLNRMPAIYRSSKYLHPGEPGKTKFRVFIGPNTPLGRGAPKPGMPFRQYALGYGSAGLTPIGTFSNNPSTSQLKNASETILVVESRESVPWTKPDELDIETFDFREPHNYLGISKRGFQALMANGDKKLFELSLKRPPEAWKAIFSGDLPP